MFSAPLQMCDGCGYMDSGSGLLASSQTLNSSSFLFITSLICALPDCYCRLQSYVGFPPRAAFSVTRVLLCCFHFHLIPGIFHLLSRPLSHSSLSDELFSLCGFVYPPEICMPLVSSSVTPLSERNMALFLFY